MRYHGMASFLALTLACAGVSAPLRAAEPAAAPASTEPAPALVPAPAVAPAEAASNRVVDPAEVAADALVVRPLGLASTVVGAAIYVVALPFAAIGGDVRGPARSLVGAPARFTFKRRLGDFESRPL
jgi:hypothetical protein